MPSTAQPSPAPTVFASDTFDRDCPGRAIMEQISNRWAALILAALASGPHRFSALHVKVSGISQKMLSQNLKALGRLGLVERSVEPTVPPQVTYSLSPLGHEFTVPLSALMEWISGKTAELLAAQARHDAGVTPSAEG